MRQRQMQFYSFPHCLSFDTVFEPNCTFRMFEQSKKKPNSTLVQNMQNPLYKQINSFCYSIACECVHHMMQRCKASFRYGHIDRFVCFFFYFFPATCIFATSYMYIISSCQAPLWRQMNFCRIVTLFNTLNRTASILFGYKIRDEKNGKMKWG